MKVCTGQGLDQHDAVVHDVGVCPLCDLMRGAAELAEKLGNVENAGDRKDREIARLEDRITDLEGPAKGHSRCCSIEYWGKNGIAYKNLGHPRITMRDKPPQFDAAKHEPIGPAVEMADEIIRIRDRAQAMGYHIEKAISEKIAFLLASGLRMPR